MYVICLCVLLTVFLHSCWCQIYVETGGTFYLEASYIEQKIESPNYPRTYDIKKDHVTEYIYRIHTDPLSSTKNIFIVFEDLSFNAASTMFIEYKNRYGVSIWHRYGSGRMNDGVISARNNVKITFRYNYTSADEHLTGWKLSFISLNEAEIPSPVYTRYVVVKVDVANGSHGVDFSTPVYSLRSSYYNVIWKIIFPPNVNRGIYFKIMTSDIGDMALTVKNGLSANDPPLTKGQGMSYYDGYLSNSNGVYVRMYGRPRWQNNIHLKFAFGINGPRFAVCTSSKVETSSPNVGFSCATTDRCIDYKYVCDGFDHCGDYSDESDYICKKNYRCFTSQFTCNNGQCINSYLKCNGAFDCHDKSDEKNCKDTNVKPGKPDISDCRPQPPVNGILIVIVVIIILIILLIVCSVWLFCRRRRARRQRTGSPFVTTSSANNVNHVTPSVSAPSPERPPSYEVVMANKNIFHLTSTQGEDNPPPYDAAIMWRRE